MKERKRELKKGGLKKIKIKKNKKKLEIKKNKKKKNVYYVSCYETS